MLALAHQYGFTALEEAVSQYLEAAVRASNVCVIYDLARLYRQAALLTVCQTFMDRSAPAVLQHATFCTMSDVRTRYSSLHCRCGVRGRTRIYILWVCLLDVLLL